MRKIKTIFLNNEIEYKAAPINLVQQGID